MLVRMLGGVRYRFGSDGLTAEFAWKVGWWSDGSCWRWREYRLKMVLVVGMAVALLLFALMKCCQ